MLLFHVRGAKSFIDLCTVNGIVKDTFRECVSLRLPDDEEWNNAVVIHQTSQDFTTS